MTEKQEQILMTALKLFAKKGFDGTSTAKVAKEACVSEGLIFKHFKNKDGLLTAVLNLGKERALEVYAPILSHENPKSVIKGIIELPFNISKGEELFWKLIYAIKWQTEVYDSSVSAPIKAALVQAFTALKYDSPEVEAELLLSIFDGLATSILLRKQDNVHPMKHALLKKYDL